MACLIKTPADWSHSYRRKAVNFLRAALAEAEAQLGASLSLCRSCALTDSKLWGNARTSCRWWALTSADGFWKRKFGLHGLLHSSSGFCLTILKIRFATGFMALLNIIKGLQIEYWEKSLNKKQWLAFSLTFVFENTHSSCSNWIWPTILKPSSKASLLTPSQWVSQGQTGPLLLTLWHHYITTVDLLASSTH